ADAAHHVREVFATLHLDRENQRGSLDAALDVLDVVDIGIGFRDRGGNRRQHAGTIDDLDPQLDAVVALHFGVPADLDAALGQLEQFGHVGAFDAMHDDALAGRKVAHDVVTRNRMATVAETQDPALGTADADLFGAM